MVVNTGRGDRNAMMNEWRWTTTLHIPSLNCSSVSYVFYFGS